MIPASPSRQFEERGALLPGTATEQASRRAALARYEALGLPNRRQETWRYTDLTALGSKMLDYVAAPPPPALLARAAKAVAGLGLAAGMARLVFVDGYFVADLSSRPVEPGLAVHTLGEQPGSLLATTQPGDSALAALNQAFVRDGAEIHVTAASSPPVALVCIASDRAVAAQLCFRLRLARGARLAVAEYRLDLTDAEEAWLNTFADIELADDSRLEWSCLQRHGSNVVATALTRVRVAAGATLVAGIVNAGGRLIRSELEILLEGPGAAAELDGLALTSGRRHCDTRYAIDHRAPRTTSRQHYRSIATDESRSVFNGKVTVREQSQNIDARQQNHSLLLSARAEVDSKPELEIYADQVACSHGATVGELDEEQLFYLRSRGVAEREARGILTQAFAAAILERFGQDDFRDRALAAVEQWLQAQAVARS
jgi:Fe-S cluster assembly protein SufD